MWMPQVVEYAGWVSTMADVGGRVREGKPPKLWSNFGHGFKTPATGAVDLSAARIPPGLGFVQALHARTATHGWRRQ